MTLNEYLDSQRPRICRRPGQGHRGINQRRVPVALGVRQVPIERCLAIERATGGKVRAEELRPDHDWSRPGKRRAS